jgi:RNA polymerase sigma-70 factor (ECF subfamily)
MPSTADPDGLLFEQLRPRLTAISRRIVGSAAEAEDIVQDCFLTWQRAERKALLTPAAWLTTVVQRRSIDLLRSRAREAAAAQLARELQPDPAPALPEAGLLREADAGDAFARLRSRLSPSERLALVLHEVFDCSHADIAAVLGTRAANARQHLARARRRLREERKESAHEERLCRELVRRFQAAIDGLDVAALVTLLLDELPTMVRESPATRVHRGPCANDASYHVALCA